MALDYVAIGTVVLGDATTDIASPVPPAHNAGDLLVAIVAGKPNTGSTAAITFTCPAAWTLIANTAGSGPAIAAGTDVGSTSIAMFEVVDGDDSITAAQDFGISAGTYNNGWAVIVALRADSGEYDIAGANGLDSTGGTPFTATMGADPGLAAGDVGVIAGSIPTDVTTPAQFSSPTLTATGITATATWRAEADCTTGLDSGGVICTATIDTGPSSAAPTVSITAGGTTTNVYGPIVVLRIRDAAVVYTDTASGTVLVTGSASDLRLFTDAPSGTVAVTGVATDSLDVGPYLAGPLGAAYLGQTYLGGTAALDEDAEVVYTDTPSGTVALSGSATDLKTYVDAVAGTVPLVGAATDVKVYADAATGSVAVTGSAVEAATGIDAPSGTVAVTGTAADASSYTDTVSGVVSVAGAVSEAAVRSADLSGTVSVTGAATDVKAYTDTATGTVGLSGSATDSNVKAYVDTSTGTVGVSGSAIETAAGTESPTGTVQVSGSVSEALSTARAVTGTVGLSGTAAGVHATADSVSGTVPITGSATDSHGIVDPYSGALGSLYLGQTYLGGSGDLAPETGTFYNDDVTGTLAVSGTLAEAHTHAPALSGTASVTGSVAGAHTVTVAVTGTIPVSGSATDAYGTVFYDTPAGVLALVGVVSETLFAADAPTGTVPVTGVLSEDFHMTPRSDRPTGLTLEDREMVLVLHG